MQVLSDSRIDNDIDVVDVTDADDLGERAVLRKELCLKYPGLESLNFKMLFQI
jgi:hypothetical protein